MWYLKSQFRALKMADLGVKIGFSGSKYRYFFLSKMAYNRRVFNPVWLWVFLTRSINCGRSVAGLKAKISWKFVDKKPFYYEKSIDIWILKSPFWPPNRPFWGPEIDFFSYHILIPYPQQKWLVIDKFSRDFSFKTVYRSLSVYTTR